MNKEDREKYMAKNQATQQRDAQTHVNMTKALDGIGNIPDIAPFVAAVKKIVQPDNLFNVATDGSHKLEIMNNVKYLPITNQRYRDNYMSYTLTINDLNPNDNYEVSLFFMPNEEYYEYTDDNLDSILQKVRDQVNALRDEYYEAAMQEDREWGSEALS